MKRNQDMPAIHKVYFYKYNILWIGIQVISVQQGLTWEH